MSRMRIPFTLLLTGFLTVVSASYADDPPTEAPGSAAAGESLSRPSVDVALAQESDEQTPPQPRTPTPRTTRPPTRTQPIRAPRRTIRLARAPNMFGDFFPVPTAVSFVAPVIDPVDPMNPTVLGFVAGEIQNPLFGGGPRLRISENNNAVPQRRVYVNYNYFHNLTRQGISGVGGQTASLNVSTLGAEVPFFNENTSLALQLPLFEPVNGQTVISSGTGDTLFTGGTSTGRIGNLAVILKQALYENDSLLFSGGLGVSLPTGADASGRVRNLRYDIRNEAVHFVPWLGVLLAPGERTFFQAFGQVDVAANGNPVQFRTGLDPQYPMLSEPQRGTFGTYNDQSLLSLDWQGGYWLLRNPRASFLTGLASMVELRYTTTLTQADRISGTAGGLTPPNMPPIPGTDINLQYTNPGGSYDMLNMNVGLHALIRERLQIRVAEVLPLRGRYNRSFDAETLVQVDLRF